MVCRKHEAKGLYCLHHTYLSTDIAINSASKAGNIETLPYSLPTDHSLHPNAVQSRVTFGGNDGMISNAQSRSQSTCPDEKVQPKKETNRSPMSKVTLTK